MHVGSLGFTRSKAQEASEVSSATTTFKLYAAYDGSEPLNHSQAESPAWSPAHVLAWRALMGWAPLASMWDVRARIYVSPLLEGS